MIYSRQEHIQFLEEELRAQTEAYKQKLETSAKYLLLERDELFVAQFIKFDAGEMILKFSNRRGLPRQGEYLYCFTVPKELRDYRNWDNRTYGDLVKLKSDYSETVCIWQSRSDDREYTIAGFRGVEINFASRIQDAEGMILLLGPNKPPSEYLLNLQSIVQFKTGESVSKILDHDFISLEGKAALLDNKRNISDFVLNQLSLQDTVIIQGPPGTGKTFLIAEICAKLCQQGKSVLVTALTNKALVELVKIDEKPALEYLLSQHKIFKSNLSLDESLSVKGLQVAKEVTPQPGNLVLATFYVTSGVAAKITEDEEPPFDYIIVDEASQSLLAMFGAAKILGKKNIWIGDTSQLPPVVALGEDKVNRKNYGALIDGLKSLTECLIFPMFQLAETHRLPDRAASFTGIFYNNSLVSKATKDIRLLYSEISSEYMEIFNPSGGPTILNTELEPGDLRPKNALRIAAEIVQVLLTSNEELKVAVLSHFVDTTKALQKAILQMVGYHKRVVIETVSKVQGLTADVTIFIIPNSSYHRSLEKRLFNVATSRAKRHTIVVADKGILSRTQIDSEVRAYLERLNREYSFGVEFNGTFIPIINAEKNSVENINFNAKQGNVDAAIDRLKTDGQFGFKVVGKVDLSKFEKPKREIQKGKHNIYIIDTNVFVDFPDIISKIDKKFQIILSAKVIDELDYIKISLSEEQKRNAHKSLRIINNSLEKRDIRMDTADLSLLPEDFSKRSPDNFILAVALRYKTDNPILMTSDNGLQIKAKGLGVTTITLKEYLSQLK